MIRDKSSPLVSIVIPCFRGEKYLSEAIDSCCRQTYENIEIIVVDDCSPDRCAAIAEEHGANDARVKLVRREQNGGVSAAFNSGFDVAGGSFFTRLAQDDLLKPNAIETLVNCLLENPHAGLAYADMEFVDADGDLLHVMHTELPENALLPANRIGLCVMWRRDVWDQVGRFDSKCDFAEDYDYWLRASEVCRFVRCDCEPLLQFRYHADQMSIKARRRHEQRTARAHLKMRWRRAGGRLSFGNLMAVARALVRYCVLLVKR